MMTGNSEHAMMLLIPLIAGDGIVYGICGLEMSDILFKRLYSPNSDRYPHIVSIIAPDSPDEIDTDKGLLAGNAYLSSKTIGLLTKEDTREGLLRLHTADGISYIGMTKPIQLYSSGSPFRDETWTAGLLTLASDLGNTGEDNRLFYGILTAILAVSLGGSLISALRSPLFTAKRYVRQEVIQEQKETAPASVLFEQFLKNLDTLSPAEQAVFALYKQDKSAQEIADALFVSINTIKFHNKNIYSKLGISSLKALKVYIGMMKEREG
jgi:DNA-binding CsgD family transcriptional regulator